MSKRLTHEQLQEITSKPGYSVSIPVGGKASIADVECGPCHESLATPSVEAGNPAKHIVRVVSIRKRLADEDNLNAKYHIDALRYAGILPNDSPAEAHIITTQIKTACKEDQCTIISIEKS